MEASAETMEQTPMEAAPMAAAEPMGDHAEHAHVHEHHDDHAREHAGHVHSHEHGDHADHGHSHMDAEPAHADPEHSHAPVADHAKPTMATKPSMATKSHQAAQPAQPAVTTPTKAEPVHPSAAAEEPAVVSQRTLDDQWQRQQQKVGSIFSSSKHSAHFVCCCVDLHSLGQQSSPQARAACGECADRFLVWNFDCVLSLSHHSISDGRNLLQLMEIVGDASLPKPAKGNMRVCPRPNFFMGLFANRCCYLLDFGF